jgi:flagellar protein FliL
MGDDDQAFDAGFDGEDVAGIETPGGEEKKGGFVGGALLKILKFAAMGIGAIIFIVTVVIITMRILNRGAESQSYPVVSEAYEARPEKLQWYDNVPEIRTRTSDQNSVTVIVKVNVGYEMEDKVLQTELIQRTPRIQDMIRQFFAQKTASQLTPEHEEELKTELKEKINFMLDEGRVKEVIFLDFNIMEF